jgi:hypothetical protein
VSRIRDISNNLVLKNKKKQPEQFDTKEEASVQLLSSLLDSIVSEKRMQFRPRMGIEINYFLGRESYGIFSLIQPIEFKRMISNLVNNAVESIELEGQVNLTIQVDKDWIEICIQDQGRGIPSEILSRLGQRGETHKKEGGSGLGLYHARVSAQSWGGDLSIDSQVGIGTAVKVRLPRALPPHWFLSQIKVSPEMTIVVLDDDSSIHRIWDSRFEPLQVQNPLVKVLHFSSPGDFSYWMNHDQLEGRILYLTDYEFIDDEENGLTVIEKHRLGASAILVTSHYENKQIRETCKRLGVKLIPKSMAGFVPISVDSSPVRYDAVLIDDDDLIHLTWKGVALSSNTNLISFFDVSSFLEKSRDIDHDSPIFIDSNLGNGLRGQDFVSEIKALGYKKIFIATGYSPETLGSIDGIMGIVGKEPPPFLRK